MPNLLSMLGMFIQERRHQKDLTHQEFLEWLDNHRFEELKRIITDTHGLEREIDLALKAQQCQIMDELRLIANSVSLIASRMNILGNVAQLVSPRIKLSDQALWMLRLLDQAVDHYPFMYIMNTSRGIGVLIGSYLYDAKEARFIRDDFADLSTLGLISKHKHNDKGEPVFGITRLGTEFAKKLPALPPED